jgi:hypothetical protein
MAAFDRIDWSALDFHAIAAHRGIATIERDQVQRCRQWLDAHRYQHIELNFDSGISPVVAELGVMLGWEEQFGYCLSGESRNLNALRDGFAFTPPEQGGFVLWLRGFETAWKEDQTWCRGLLSICSEYSLWQIALARRFFAMVEVGLVDRSLVDRRLVETSNANTMLLGATFEGIAVPYPFRFRDAHTEDRVR